MKYEVSMSLSGKKVVHAVYGRNDSEELLIPSDRYEVPEWKEAVQSRYPTVDWEQVEQLLSEE